MNDSGPLPRPLPKALGRGVCSTVVHQNLVWRSRVRASAGTAHSVLPSPTPWGGAGGGVRLVLLVFAVFLVVACQSNPWAEAPTNATAAASGRARQTARVVRVIDGDTILVDLNGRQERVRYIGVPEGWRGRGRQS